MSKREKDYIEKLYKRLSKMLDNLLETDIVDWDEKETILHEMKYVIDEYIREFHNNSLLE